MDNTNSGGTNFAFGVTPNSANKQQSEQKVQTPVQPVEKADNLDFEVDNTIDPEAEYTYNRSITIVLKKNYSMYRRSNDKTLPKKIDYIGSSVSSSRILASNKEEVDHYFPNIVGLAPADSGYMQRVKNFLNNIRIQVDEIGKTFNNSFHFYHYKDYVRFRTEESKIEYAYNKVPRNNEKQLREALNRKIIALNTLESELWKYGYPIDIDDYLMYRHCLLYKDVAKDVSFINSDHNIRFYFKDDVKEAEKLKKYRVQVNKAKANYVACLADDKLFDAIYMQYCNYSALPIISSLAKDRIDREIELDNFSTNEPVKFNEIFNNKDVKLIGDIELLIARGELVRYSNNQQITTSDGGYIGKNMTEAVAWFKDPNNASVVNAYFNKLKLA